MTKAIFTDLIKNFRFVELFNSLGWDRDDTPVQSVTYEGVTFNFQIVASKRGFRIVEGSTKEIPPRSVWMRGEAYIKARFAEHILIFTDSLRRRQVWHYSYREEGRRRRAEVDYHINQDAERLYGRLLGLVFDIDEEDNITIVDVSSAVRRGFGRNTERVTRSFYDGFKREHTALLSFMRGIEAAADKEWYASALLNRLMFCYFMQKKGFLDGDREYLKNKLKWSKERLGEDKFYSFYRSFLLELFRKGFNAPRHSEEVRRVLGRVPYLNGGLFDLHEVERRYPHIDISDGAFERVFAFFDTFDWYLDTRVTATGREINPDILGYIFEKYINDRADKGAYYTREDITNYITRSALLPFILERVRERYPEPFRKGGAVWELLKNNGNAYIFEDVKRGAELPLPEEIERGVNSPKSREGWNVLAAAEYALPNEIWREAVERRGRYKEIKGKIDRGEIGEARDLITFNLDIEGFTLDLISSIEDSNFVRVFYEVLGGVTVLDPTCGSGAFLFAALNILEPLYEEALIRMEDYLRHDYKGILDKRTRGFFEAKLEEVEGHPNREYFILKSIILNNLYGVDIMREAVETAKLRLFLKLVSATETDFKKDNIGIEPLPDIDFNIKAGNTLIGFAHRRELEEFTLTDVLSREAVEEALSEIPLLSNAVKRYKELQLEGAYSRKSEFAASGFGSLSQKARFLLRSSNSQFASSVPLAPVLFAGEQAKPDGAGGEGVHDDNTFIAAKRELSLRQEALKGKMDHLLWQSRYSNEEYGAWLKSHMPFHWLSEFYPIIENGGFDVIIGNPPYVEYGGLRGGGGGYRLKDFDTLPCGNLHAFVAERAFSLAANNGFVGFIVPLATIGTKNMAKIQEKLKSNTFNIWVSSFDERPSKLFNGVDQRVIIEIIKMGAKKLSVCTTGINKWCSEERSILFSKLYYTKQSEADIETSKTILKLKTSLESSILAKLFANQPISAYLSDVETENILYYRTAGGRYWKVLFDKPTETGTLSEKKVYLNGLTSSQAVAILSSCLFWWYYSIHFDMLNLKDYMIFGFRISNLSENSLKALDILGKKYVQSLEDNAKVMQINSKTRGAVIQKQFLVKHSKHIIDEIDRILGEHYGFTEEELDFILNYDIKFRSGGEEE